MKIKMASDKNKNIPTESDANAFLDIASGFVEDMKIALRRIKELEKRVQTLSVENEYQRKENETKDTKIEEQNEVHKRERQKWERQLKERTEKYAGFKQQFQLERQKFYDDVSGHTDCKDKEDKLKQEIDRLETSLSEAKRELEHATETRLSNSPYRTKHSPVEKTRTFLGDISSQIDCLEDHVNSVQVSTGHAKDTNQVAEIRSLKDQLKAKDDIIKKYAMTKTSKPTDDILQQYEIQMEKIAASYKILKQDVQKKEKLLKTAESREKNFKDDIAKLEKEVQILDVKLQSSEKELDETRNRLSEQMGTNLTDNNPNIADLSDQNRPTKLGERYSQLYDNPWTEAYEALEKHVAEEQNIIEVLRNILVNASKYCENKANDQMQQLQNVFFRPEAKRGGNLDHVRKQLKDFRKASVEKTAKEYFQSYWSDLKKQSSKIELAQLSLCVKEYVEDCFTICWMMAVQDPPVVLGSIPERGNAFDKNQFREYTQSGPVVEFVVWPPLFLHAEGPILSKGVAQGYGSARKRGTRNTTQRDVGHQADARIPTTEGGREDVLQSRHAAVHNAEHQRGYEAGDLGYGGRSPGDTRGYGDKSPGAQNGYVSRSPKDKLGYGQGNNTRKQDVWQDYTERSSTYNQGYSSSNTPKDYTYSRQSAATKSPPDRPNSASRKGRVTPTKRDMELYIKYLKSGGFAHAKRMLGDDLYKACLFNT